jgi:hypothetical protein
MILSQMDRYFDIVRTVDHYDLELVGKHFTELTVGSGHIELHFARSRRGKVGHWWNYSRSFEPLEEVVAVVAEWKELENQLRQQLAQLDEVPQEWELLALETGY